MAKMSSVLDSLISAELSAKATVPILSDGSTLANVMNDSASTVKTTARAARGQKGTSVKPATVVPTTPTNVQNGVALPATPIQIPGVTLSFSGGEYPVELIKTIAAYKGKNPFYALCEFMATAKKSCYVTITAEKSQASKVKSALHSLQDREIVGASKLVVRSTTEKGMCVLIRRP